MSAAPQIGSFAAPWTKNAPSSWHRTYLGHLVDVRSGATPSKDEPLFWDGEIPWVSPKDMKVLRIEDSEDHVTEAALSSSTLRWVAQGSVLMVTRGMILDHTVPVALAERPLTINQDMKALVPRADLRGDFLMWLLVGLNPAILARVEEAAHGTKALRTEQWRKLPLAIPPEPLQRRIADFLDRKTAAIDALIAKKEQLLTLLAEKRQALVTQAVTKGLDPNAPMKDSDYAALPAIPRDWQIVPLRYLLSFGPRNGISPPSAPDRDGVLSFSISAVREGRVTIDGNEKFVDLDRAFARAYWLAPGDILLMRGNGNLSLVGTCGLVESTPDECTYPDILMKMRVGRRLLPKFLVSAINSPYVRGQVETLAKTSNGTFKLSGEDVRTLRIAVPPLEEQERIVAYLRKEISRLDGVARRVEAMIEKLREYRQALITAAVTGKLEVASASPTALTPSHNAAVEVA